MRHFGGSVLAALAVIGLAPSAPAADLPTVLREHLSSRGGYDRVVGLLRYEMRGTVTKDGRLYPMHVWWKRPNKMRIDIGRGDETTSLVYDGQTAWTVQKGPWGKEPAGIAPGLRELFLRQADWEGPLTNPERKGITVTKDPRVWGEKGYQILVERTGADDSIFLNADTRMTSWEVFRVGPPGFEVRFEQRYSKFRRTEGFALPHRIERFADASPYDVIEIDEVLIGPPVDDSHFAAPAFHTSKSESPRLMDMNELSQLRDRFRADAGRVRVVAILSPTSPESRRGYLELRGMIDSTSDDRTAAYVVWSPIVETDRRTEAAARALEYGDKRVTFYWDGGLAAAQTWGDVLKLKRNAWDVYLVYGPEAKWESSPPVPDLWMYQGIGSKPGYDLSRAQGVAKIRELLAATRTDGKKKRASASDQ